MAWEFKDISVDEINELTKEATVLKSPYAEIYDKIFSLEVGSGFCFETKSHKEATNIRVVVANLLKRRGLNDKYVISNRMNVVYCGRLK